MFPGYKVFAKHYPEKEQEMKKALLYAIESITNVEELLYFLNEFGEWIIKESDKWLQIHIPSNANNVIKSFLQFFYNGELLFLFDY